MKYSSYTSLNNIIVLIHIHKPISEIVKIINKRPDFFNELSNKLKFKLQQNEVCKGLYHLINDIDNIPICDCGKYRSFESFKFGYHKTCGDKSCVNSSRVNSNKLHNLKYYGVENCMQRNDVKKKFKNTMLERHGVEFSQQSDILKQKTRNTCIKHFGENHHMKNEFIKNKRLETIVRNDNFPGFFKYKNYTFPSGNKVRIQGYENIALDKLLEQYDECDILCKASEICNKIGVIRYHHGGIKHRFVPDIYIISINKIIEVKSRWTYGLHLEINKLKQQACIDAGFSFEFMFMD